MRTKFIVKYGIIAMRFSQKSFFFSSILGGSPHWVFKNYDEYISEKIINLSSIDRIHLKCDVIDGSVLNGVRQPIWNSFVLDKSPGFKVLCEPGTVH